MKKQHVIALVLFIAVSSPIFSCGPYIPRVQKKTGIGKVLRKVSHPFKKEYVYVENEKRTKRLEAKK